MHYAQALKKRGGVIVPPPPLFLQRWIYPVIRMRMSHLNFTTKYVKVEKKINLSRSILKRLCAPPHPNFYNLPLYQYFLVYFHQIPNEWIFWQVKEFWDLAVMCSLCVGKQKSLWRVSTCTCVFCYIQKHDSFQDNVYTGECVQLLVLYKESIKTFNGGTITVMLDRETRCQQSAVIQPLPLGFK